MIKPCARRAVPRGKPWLNMVREDRRERTRGVKGTTQHRTSRTREGPEKARATDSELSPLLQTCLRTPRASLRTRRNGTRSAPARGRKAKKGGEHLDRSGARPLEVDNTRNTPVVVHENIILVEISEAKGKWATAKPSICEPRKNRPHGRQGC